jgi:hypothetical protein
MKGGTAIGTSLSRDKNIVPFKVATIAAFCFMESCTCPMLKTRTWFHCRKGQEHDVISD